MLRGDEEKARWKNLIALECTPSLYPYWDAIYGLGIETSWNTLVEAGSLAHLFGAKYQSYKVLTVDLITALEVSYMDKKEDEVSKFNLSRAKINAVRKPVLRYMLKSLVYLPFAHTKGRKVKDLSECAEKVNDYYMDETFLSAEFIVAMEKSLLE
ncbi:hypothetical protein SASPL_102318 [Salvia splendens]|uniref:Uncharacterized protein n=1 Tax=Salvia splendens TaxID=180675 RepID=A0A8X9AC12_SALSN|nr:hypothetical protein SASPL_102318 [Salvia splendens]